MNGEYGFKVKRAFPASREYVRDDVLTPEEALAIPIRNRIALERAGYVEFLAEPADKSLQVVIDKQAKEIATLKAENEKLKAGATSKAKADGSKTNRPRNVKTEKPKQLIEEKEAK